MSAASRILIAVVVIAVAGVGGYGAARALSTDGPDPHIDAPVVVRPAGDSTDSPADGKDDADDGTGHRGDHRPGGDSHDTPRDDPEGGDDSDDDSGHGSDDDFEPVHPTPNTFDDDDDDDDDSGHGGDDGDD